MMKVTISKEVAQPARRSLIVRVRTKSGDVISMKPNRFGLSLVAVAALMNSYLSRPTNFLVSALEKRLIFDSSSIEEIISSGVSIVRWGDGDTMSALQFSNNFEDASRELSRDLFRLFEITQGSTLLLGVPQAVLTSDLRATYSRSRLKVWNLTLLLLVVCIRRRMPVVDSLMFRSGNQVTRLARAIKGRSVILVAPSSSQELIRDRLGLSEFSKILVSETQNFREIKDTARAVNDEAKRLPFPLVLVSGGSGGRILISSIFDRVQCIDIGQLR